MRDSCVIYESYISAIRALPEEYQLNMYNIIFDYIFKDIEPEKKSSVEYALFLSMKTNIDRAKNRYNASVKNGGKGGASKGNQNAKKQPESTQKQPKST